MSLVVLHMYLAVAKTVQNEVVKEQILYNFQLPQQKIDSPVTNMYIKHKS